MFLLNLAVLIITVILTVVVLLIDIELIRMVFDGARSHAGTWFDARVHRALEHPNRVRGHTRVHAHVAGRACRTRHLKDEREARE